eukprot:4455848-Alexandrium_andersonii.AAC.1
MRGAKGEDGVEVAVAFRRGAPGRRAGRAERGALRGRAGHRPSVARRVRPSVAPVELGAADAAELEDEVHAVLQASSGAHGLRTPAEAALQRTGGRTQTAEVREGWTLPGDVLARGRGAAAVAAGDVRAVAGQADGVRDEAARSDGGCVGRVADPPGSALLGRLPEARREARDALALYK